ncbi:beta-lactamase family protein [Burkholderia sp. AU30280]|uniref:serine hydrolase domain-containing protein n=1 Tax=Burkholderia sp. AU30280 TaxID=2879628 RepID=UPI001CF28547|nr:serine hydrolase domain-containing protein [Burkholderia sp. AU30280]MCA8275628.1 beta-lactamase family protein [Burkholderia sp. AU30280]
MPDQLNRRELTRRLDAVTDHAIRNKRVLGTVLMVAIDGETVYRRAAGLADRETNTPMSEDAIFRLSSVTKPLTSAAIMVLVERGVIALDHHVTRYLPEFRPRLADGTAPDITLGHLLTHTSGLGYRFLDVAGGHYDQADISDGLDQPNLSLDENLRRLASVPLRFAPGERWNYSLGLDVLGAVIERATGESFPNAMHRLVTSPLGLDDLTFHVDKSRRLVKPYVDGHPDPVAMTDESIVPAYANAIRYAPSRIHYKDSYPSGGCGMAGTAGDILQFLEVIRKGGAPILQRSTVEDMMRDHVGPQAGTQGPGWGFGYGWAVLSDAAASDSPQSPGTLQWGGVYGHNWFIDPLKRLTVVSLTNTTFEGMSGAYPNRIRDALYA